MPADPETTQTLTQWLLAAFGLGGGGYKLVTHETRIKRLEEDRIADLKKTDANTTAVAEMKGTLDGVAKTVRDIHNLLMDRGDR